MLYRSLILLPLVAAALAGCKPENKFQPPPPAEISVAKPLQKEVQPFEVLTGNTVAFNTVDLVARVEGFLTSINYTDGGFVKKGDTLFVIEQTMYQAKVKQAQAKLDSARANVENQEGNLVIAQTNLGYTTVVAPYDGVVTKHLISVGELVGNGVATKLATIVQLNPIYVEFNMSEQDVLNIRDKLKRRLTVEELSKIPLDIGLMDEEGFPHQGFLNYVSPELDPMTGTILVRGLFNNPNRDLLPGFFARIRVPTATAATADFIIPDRVIAEDQAGKYVLVVNKDNVVEQRRVTLGQLLVGGLRVIATGLTADDRVVLTTNGKAVPGGKVVPKETTIATPPAAAIPAAATPAATPATPPAAPPAAAPPAAPTK